MALPIVRSFWPKCHPRQDYPMEVLPPIPGFCRRTQIGHFNANVYVWSCYCCKIKQLDFGSALFLYNKKGWRKIDAQHRPPGVRVTRGWRLKPRTVVRDAVLAVCKEPFLDLFKKKHDTDAKLSRDTRSAGFVVVTKEAKSGHRGDKGQGVISGYNDTVSMTYSTWLVQFRYTIKGNYEETWNIVILFDCFPHW